MASLRALAMETLVAVSFVTTIAWTSGEAMPGPK